MSIELATAGITCSSCKLRRAQRYCLRNGIDICWVCCNDRRIDRKCPQECQYIIQRQDGGGSSPALSAKVDSLKEHNDLLKRHIDLWIELPEKMFADRIPSEMVKTAEGKREIENYINDISKQPAIPITYLRQRLGLSSRGQEKPDKNFEEIAEEYIESVVAGDWEGAISLQANAAHYKRDLYRSNYLKRRNGTKLFQIIKSWHLILSGFSQEGNEAILFYEINYKYDMTLHIVKEGVDWKIKEVILGNPKFYYGEGEAIKQITTLLTNNSKTEAYNLLRQYHGVLIDSADIHYLYGLYYAMDSNLTKATPFFYNATEIDPNYYDAKYNLAFSLQHEKKLVLAKELYLELFDTNPKDVKVMNNLALIYEAERDFNKAWELINRCLELSPDFEASVKNRERMKKMYGIT